MVAWYEASLTMTVLDALECCERAYVPCLQSEQHVVDSVNGDCVMLVRSKTTGSLSHSGLIAGQCFRARIEKVYLEISGN